MRPTNKSKATMRSKPVVNNAVVVPEQQVPREIDPGAVQLVKSVITIIDEMVQIMDNEITLVEKRQMKEHGELLKRKQRLATDYRATFKTIALNPNYLKHVPEDLAQSALQAGRKLTLASERNSRALRAAITAVERLAKTIISIVKEEVLPAQGYANTYAGPAKMRYSPLCKPVTGSRTA